jgi:hypothetical protein
MKTKETIAYKRPTQAVRQRPYIFFRSIRNYVLEPPIPGVQSPNVVTLQPQGNIADGNRVTHGWKIYINFIAGVRTDMKINLNGNIINLGTVNQPFLLIDTTLDPLGIDSTIYNIFSASGSPEDKYNLFVVEQILQISPM